MKPDLFHGSCTRAPGAEPATRLALPIVLIALEERLRADARPPGCVGAGARNRSQRRGKRPTDKNTSPTASRTTFCAWCEREIETTVPWRPNEFQLHTDCLPLLDEYRESVQRLLWRDLGDVLTVNTEGHGHD